MWDKWGRPIISKSFSVQLAMSSKASLMPPVGRGMEIYLEIRTGDKKEFFLEIPGGYLPHKSDLM